MDISGRGIMLQKLENDGLVGKVLHFELGLVPTSECKVFYAWARPKDVTTSCDPDPYGYTS